MINHPNKHTPALRFPEFTDSWQQTKADAYFENRRTKGKSELDIFAVTMRNGLVPRKSLERDHGPDAEPENNLRIEPNDLVYNMMRMWQGAVGKAETAGMVSPAYVVLKPKQHTFPDFFLAFFKSRLGLHLLKSYSYGLTSDRLRLYFRDFAKIPVSVPSSQEQDKIASFLSAIDKRLEQLRKKRDLLETYKRGVMQKIFSQEIRFKADDGSDFPDWTLRKLSDIATFSKGKGIPKTLTNKSGRTACILYGELYTKFKEIISETYLYTNEKDNYLILSEKHDILIPSSGETRDDIARSSCVMMKGIAIGSDINIIKTNQFSPFISYQLSGLYKNQLARLAQGNSVVHLHTRHIRNLEMLIPTIPEQIKISDFLTKLDERKSSIQNELRDLSIYKQGLLQKLFV